VTHTYDQPVSARHQLCIDLYAVFDICYGTRYTLQCTKHFADPSVGGATSRKIAVEILQSVNNRMQSLQEILRMVIIDTVINTILSRLTLDPASTALPST